MNASQYLVSGPATDFMVSGPASQLVVSGDAPSFTQLKVPGTQINLWLALGVAAAGYVLLGPALGLTKKSKRSRA